MDLRNKCASKAYGNCIIQVAKSAEACRCCSKSKTSCKYQQDHKTAWKTDSEYCFDNVRDWMSYQAHMDYYVLKGW